MVKIRYLIYLCVLFFVVSCDDYNDNSFNVKVVDALENSDGKIDFGKIFSFEWDSLYVIEDSFSKDSESISKITNFNFYVPEFSRVILFV